MEDKIKESENHERTENTNSGHYIMITNKWILKEKNTCYSVIFATRDLISIKARHVSDISRLPLKQLESLL